MINRIILKNSCCLFAFICFCLTTTAQSSLKQITLEDIWKKGTFRMKSVPGFNAMKDGKRFSQIDRDAANEGMQIAIYQLVDGKKNNVVFDSKIATFNGSTLKIDHYQFSENEQKLLLFTEGEAIYRRSYLYKVYVYDIKTKNLSLLDESKVLHASFNPNGDKVAYVKENNLHIKDLNKNTIDAITADGKLNEIINGNCDWVYEEELEFTKAFEWSTEGNYLAYYKFDESNVLQYTMTKYNGLYPEPYQYKYPKAGDPNSKVSILIYNVKSGTTVAAAINPENDQYIPRIKWTMNDDRLLIFRLNRLQNHLEILATNSNTGNTEIVYTETNKSYIEIHDNVICLKNEPAFIFTSEQSGYNQLYKWNWNTKELSRITDGLFDIESVVSFDEKKKILYYVAAEQSPLERKLYAISMDGKQKKCLTPLDGTHQITACNGNLYFLDKHSRIGQVPEYHLIDANGKKIRTLEKNESLKTTMNTYQFGNVQLLKIKGVSDSLNAWMITPPSMDSNKKYPVLMYQYSGPGSQMVADKFPVGDYFWHQMLATKGYIVICIDGTGTGFRGEAFKKKTYLQLGKYESDDQIAAAKQLATWEFVDEKRIGIWGWSYGGFMSSTCLFKGNDIFKAAIAVAPVTNWRYYDNIYTERYMRTPLENPDGYDNNAPEKMAKHLKGNYLLIHGTADDNVHFQNAVMLSEQLIQANKPFEQAYYPDKNHGIGGGNTRLHLYEKMTKFILENL
jgi:dipeptidyl-peptidase-4